MARESKPKAPRKAAGGTRASKKPRVSLRKPAGPPPDPGAVQAFVALGEAPGGTPAPRKPAGQHASTSEGQTRKGRFTVTRADGRELRPRTIYFPVGESKALDVHCIQTDQDASDVVAAAVREYLARRGGSVQGQLFQAPPEPAPAESPPPRTYATEKSRRVAKGKDLETFAREVTQAAMASPTGHFGEDRVFLRHVYRAWLHEQGERMAWPVFGELLLEANRRALLRLARADMPEMMPAEDVRDSELRHLGATFHFLAL